MAKQSQSRPRRSPRTQPPEIDAAEAPPGFDQSEILTSSLSLHELFQQQTQTMLDRADLDEEQKQAILVAMTCPCCGAGGMSLTVKLKR